MTNSTTYTCLLLKSMHLFIEPEKWLLDHKQVNSKNSKKNCKIVNSKDLPHHRSQKTRTRNYFLFLLGGLILLVILIAGYIIIIIMRVLTSAPAAAFIYFVSIHKFV